MESLIRVSWFAERREHLVEAGDHGEFLGFHGIGAGPAEHLDRVVTDVGPRRLEAHTSVELLGVEVRVDRARRVAECHVERIVE